MTTHYDIIVIGAGGGSKISTPASKRGFKVALVEMNKLGGTCLNRGCIPSKMLIHCAEVAQIIDEAGRFQIDAKGYEVNFQQLVDRVANTIDSEAASIEPAIEANPNITWYREKASFVGERTLQVGSEQISADKIFIATGARPKLPPLPGLAETPYLTSTEALRLNKQPKRMIVLGGGYIGVEMAHYFGSLGTEIHVIEPFVMLGASDSQVRDEFVRVFSQRFKTYIGAKPTQVNHANGQFEVLYTDPDGKEARIQADQLLVTTGVAPNTELDLAKTGVQTTQRGFIKVNSRLDTDCPGIWAFGDVVGNYLFRHSANFEAEYLFANVVLGEDQGELDYQGMPHAVFSYPQIAGVGETEDQLKKRGANYVAGVNPYAKSAMGMALLADHGFVKMLIEKGTRKILGCHIIGHEASVLIHEVTPLFRLGGRLDDILLSIHVHPALSELVRNAARKARDELVSAGEEIPTLLQLK